MHKHRLGLVSIILAARLLGGCAESTHSSGGLFVSNLRVEGNSLVQKRCQMNFDVVPHYERLLILIPVVVLYAALLLAAAGGGGGGGGGSIGPDITDRAISSSDCETKVDHLAGAL